MAKSGCRDLSNLLYLVDTVKRYVKAAHNRDEYLWARQEQALPTSLAEMLSISSYPLSSLRSLKLWRNKDCLR